MRLYLTIVQLKLYVDIKLFGLMIIVYYNKYAFSSFGLFSLGKGFYVYDEIGRNTHTVYSL